MAEDEESVCGYVVAAVDSKDLATKSNESWVPAMQNKYPKPAKEALSPAEVSAFLVFKQRPEFLLRSGYVTCETQETKLWWWWGNYQCLFSSLQDGI